MSVVSKGALKSVNKHDLCALHDLRDLYNQLRRTLWRPNIDTQSSISKIATKVTCGKWWPFFEYRAKLLVCFDEYDHRLATDTTCTVTVNTNHIIIYSCKCSSTLAVPAPKVFKADIQGSGLASDEPCRSGEIRIRLSMQRKMRIAMWASHPQLSQTNTGA